MEALLAKLVVLLGSLGEVEALAPGWRAQYHTNILPERFSPKSREDG